MALITDIRPYFKKSRTEIEWFEDFMLRHPELEFTQPAPWHVQCRLDNGVLINFWPHVCKAMIQDQPPVAHGTTAIEELVADAKTYIDFEVIEYDHP